MELRSLESRGLISGLRTQVRYVLMESFTYEGKKERGIDYVADFYYRLPDGTPVVEDTKGYRTDVYRIKRKLFISRYPQIKFVES